MGRTTLPWVQYTFNPWWGCTQVSPACDHCYAMVLARRLGQRAFGHPVEWGPAGRRGYLSEKGWAGPLAWDRRAQKTGERPRVFCGSMMDVFEGKAEQRPHLARLYALIEQTPHLDWLLLTKRPNQARQLGPGRWPGNVWIGCTVETQAWAEQRLPHLLSLDCTLRFLSVEPLLGPLDLRPVLGHGPGRVNWIVLGGESGSQARGPDGAVDWYRDLRQQCGEAGVPLFFKQWGRFRQDGSDLVRLRPREPRAEPAALDGIVQHEVPKLP
jgi:protein gp37